MSNEKIIWFKKAKCAGTSFESILQETGSIMYVDERTTRDELEDPAIKIICLRGEIAPASIANRRQKDGTYQYKRYGGFFWRLKRKIFSPKDFMIENYPDVLEKWHKFAIVRNPYDKFISSWKYLKSTRDKPLTYVINNLPDISNHHDWLHITKKQIDYVVNKDGQSIIDQVIYMEEGLDEDINHILTRVSLEDRKLPVKNKSQRCSYLEYLTPEVRDLILEKYKDDFDFFGYDYDERNIVPVNKWQPTS